MFYSLACANLQVCYRSFAREVTAAILVFQDKIKLINSLKVCMVKKYYI